MGAVFLPSVFAGSKINSDFRLDAPMFLGAPREKHTSTTPAKDGMEWEKRLAKAAKQMRMPLTDLYAELPPEDQWENIPEALRKQQKTNLGHDTKKKHHALKIFQELLQGDMIKAQQTYFEIVKGKSFDKWDYNRNLETLMKLGMSKEEVTDNITLEVKPPNKGQKEKWKQLLSDGEIDKAIRLLEKENETSSWNKIYKIGRLYKRKDLIDSGLEGMKKTIDADKFAELSFYRNRDYLNALLAEKKYQTLHTVSKKLLTQGQAHRNNPERLLPYYYISVFNEDGNILEELKKLPDYGVTNIDKLRETLNYGASGKEFGLLIVKALKTSNRENEALDLLKNLLLTHGGHDPYYRYFLENFEGKIGFFDDLLAWNPYQERPLIWKGHFLIKQGKLDLAEKAINAAIALDPSDGEQGKDTRMEVYNALSKLLKLRGDEEKSKFFSEVMKAIRAGEVADDFLNLGLHDEAIKRYRAALGHFEDAYCLQSRLAKTLLEKGDLKEAKKHFEKAFKLMPVSFGPVESHCFGCEGIFEDIEAQKIAEKVFKQVTAESPENPRTYYLIAKLYEEQNKFKNALDYYLQAFERDKSYYNCAKRIHYFMQIYPELKAENQDVLSDIEKCYPYANLDQLFKNRIDLKDSWQDAQELATTRPIPIEIPELPTLFKEEQNPEDDSELGSEEFFAFDGWEAHELLRDNNFLQNLSFFWAFN